MTKMRESQGGAFESRGKYFARVTVAPNRTEAVLLPGCRSLDDAKRRAADLQERANRLRAEPGADERVDVRDLTDDAREGKL